MKLMHLPEHTEAVFARPCFWLLWTRPPSSSKLSALVRCGAADARLGHMTQPERPRPPPSEKSKRN